MFKHAGQVLPIGPGRGFETDARTNSTDVVASDAISPGCRGTAPVGSGGYSARRGSIAVAPMARRPGSPPTRRPPSRVEPGTATNRAVAPRHHLYYRNFLHFL